MSLNALGFTWDAANRLHCRKHGMSEDEVESMFSGVMKIAPDPAHSGREERFVAIGRTSAGRAAFVVFTMRDGFIRPISARYMHAKEVRRHEP